MQLVSLIYTGSPRQGQLLHLREVRLCSNASGRRLWPESNATDFEEKSKNSGASGSTSFALHDYYDLRTDDIAFGSKECAGKSIDSAMAETMNSKRKWHIRSRIVSPQERHLSTNVLKKINETCAAMLLPKLLVETAAMLYRNFESNYEAKGRSIACMAAAATI